MTGFPAQLIKHLSISDDNYTVALDLLKAEFLDVDYIKSQIFTEILEYKLSADLDLESVRAFFTHIRANLSELNSSHGLDFLCPNTPGSELLSHVVFQKLPSLLKRELIRIGKTNYPKIDFVLENIADVIRSLECTLVPKTCVQKLSSDKYVPPFKRNNNNVTRLRNFHMRVETKKVFKCNLCSSNSHGLNNCPNHCSVENKLKICKSKYLCSLCASPRHNSASCKGNNGSFRPCIYCNKRTHFSALCSQKDDVPNTARVNSGIIDPAEPIQTLHGYSVRVSRPSNTEVEIEKPPTEIKGEIAPKLKKGFKAERKFSQKKRQNSPKNGPSEKVNYGSQKNANRPRWQKNSDAPDLFSNFPNNSPLLRQLYQAAMGFQKALSPFLVNLSC